LKQLIVKLLIIALPTYAVAILTEKMVYTMPMLAITSIIASNVFKLDEEGEGTESD
tara:strand:- start:12465 stop:12632 length:168 start_codon:yes stop_codon:yes gene_type:complete